MASLDIDLAAVRSYLCQLEGLLARVVDDDRQEPDEPRDDRPSARGGLADWQISRIERFVADNICRNVSLEDLARITRLSHGHLCRAFRISKGDSPHRYVMRMRVENAKILMLASKANLSEIAYGCGLTDQAHLSRLFKMFVGQTPMAWRSEQRQDGPRVKSGKDASRSAAGSLAVKRADRDDGSPRTERYSSIATMPSPTAVLETPSVRRPG
jgi:AraC-like DNA-binding protein